MTAFKSGASVLASDARSAGQEAASSQWLVMLARAGLVARGINYALIGFLAVQVAFGAASHRAESSGALRAVAAHRGGTVVLWVLAAGFVGMTLWRLAEAAYGKAGAAGKKLSKRLASLASAVCYGLLLAATIGFLRGGKPQSSGNQQSKALTAQFMGHPGGRWLVLLVGLVVAGVGLKFAWGGMSRTFMKQLNLGTANRRTQKVVEALGMFGTSARGIVFCVVGGFLAAAAITFDAKQAQGLDGTLRKFATTPLGPWLLVAVAVGLITFGIYSCCEARWRDVRPG